MAPIRQTTTVSARAFSVCAIILTGTSLTGSRTWFETMSKNAIMRSVLLAGIGVALLLLAGLSISDLTA
jgi:hypothetical protein